MESVRLLRVEGFHKFVEKRPTISIAILNIKIIQIERVFIYQLFQVFFSIAIITSYIPFLNLFLLLSLV